MWRPFWGLTGLIASVIGLLGVAFTALNSYGLFSIAGRLTAGAMVVLGVFL